MAALVPKFKSQRTRFQESSFLSSMPFVAISVGVAVCVILFGSVWFSEGALGASPGLPYRSSKLMSPCSPIQRKIADGLPRMEVALPGPSPIPVNGKFVISVDGKFPFPVWVEPIGRACEVSTILSKGLRRRTTIFFFTGKIQGSNIFTYVPSNHEREATDFVVLLRANLQGGPPVKLR